MERIGLWALRKELDGLKHERSDLKDLISMTLKASDTFSALKTTYLNRLKLVDKKLSKNFLDYLQVLTEDEKKPFGRIIFYGELRGKMVEKSFKCVLDISESAMVIDKAFQVEPCFDLIVPKPEKYLLMSTSLEGLIIGELSNKWTIVCEVTANQFFADHKELLQSIGIGQSDEEGIIKYMMSNIERCDKDIFRSELSGIIIGVPAGMKNFISLESVDEKIKKNKPTIVGITKHSNDSLEEIMERAAAILQNNMVFQEMRALKKFNDLVSKESNDSLKSFCHGLMDTVKAIESKSLSSCLIYDRFEAKRWTLRKKATKDNVAEERVQVFPSGSNEPIFDANAEDVVLEEDFMDWLIETSKKPKLEIELISENSQKGMDFIEGTGGVAGIMMFKQDLLTP